jgi:subfamily B ATP-binding cassette protein MsbA
MSDEAPAPADSPPSGGDWSTYRRLLGYVRPYWFVFLLAILGFLVGSAAEAYFVKLFGDLIDNWDDIVVRASWAIPATMCVVALVRGSGEVIGEMLLSQISFGVVHNIRTALFDRLLLMPSAYFDASSQGHLVSRLTYNVAQLRDAGTDALKTIIQDGGKVIVYLGYMFYLSWKLTLIFVAAAPLVGLVAVYASRRFRRISRRIQNSMGDVTHVASEAVAGYRVVRIFGGEAYEQARFHKSSRSNRRQNLKMVATKVSSTQVIQVLVAVALALLIGLLFRPEIGGTLSTGQVVTFLGLSGLLARPIRKLSEVNARLQRGLAAAEDVFGQMDADTETDLGSVTTERVAGRLEFRDVSFTYERGSAPVLSHVSFTVDPGKTVALVGRSGSGKTTIASLIPRFYEPTGGEILLDGVPLPRYRLEALRSQIALVTQQVTLFNDTLERNIAYGALAGAEPDEVDRAVRRAYADRFVSELPDGLQTVVGDDGVLLSGGQRQRVAIARALLKDAPVLILDEATSALDTESERHIRAALEEVMRGRTTLVIAHRLSTIENADEILVIDEGRIVEAGTHQGLLNRGGHYAALYQAQFDEEPDSAPVSEAPTGSTSPGLTGKLTVGQTLRPLAQAWYTGSRWTMLLAPFAWAFERYAVRRRLRFLTGKRRSWRSPVPVIVVGNITAGGTGKTPMVIWVVEQLRALGYSPGVVSRGYGGKRGPEPLLVTPDSDPAVVGDEAPMIASRARCPVVVAPDRARAVESLLQAANCDVVVSDDGLQHYALARDLEIALIDGHRGVGNGRCLPAGPLREPVSRLESVDWVISNGLGSGIVAQETVMTLIPTAFVRVTPGPGEARQRPEDFVAAHPNVNAVAGVGNPARFALALRELGLAPVLHAQPDHHPYDGSELAFDNDWPVVCTEKDAVKIRRLTDLPADVWYLEVEAHLPDGAAAFLEELLRAHGIRRHG